MTNHSASADEAEPSDVTLVCEPGQWLADQLSIEQLGPRLGDGKREELAVIKRCPAGDFEVVATAERLRP